ncbi:MAG: hypothetical protein AAFU54_18070 [Chloroflexota bacterium]
MTQWRGVARLQITRIFPTLIRVERMPRGRLDFLAVNRQVHNLVILMHDDVEHLVLTDLPGQFIVDPMVLE